jgi:hypothetical protein
MYSVSLVMLEPSLQGGWLAPKISIYHLSTRPRSRAVLFVETTRRCQGAHTLSPRPERIALTLSFLAAESDFLPGSRDMVAMTGR